MYSEQQELTIANCIIAYKREHKKLPTKSNVLLERVLSRHLDDFRKSKNTSIREDDFNEMSGAFVKWFEKNERIPSETSENILERYLSVHYAKMQEFMEFQRN